jgi:hypothetical protein
MAIRGFHLTILLMSCAILWCFAPCPASLANVDDVLKKGDSSEYGMKIKSAEFNEAGFSIRTTGAELVYASKNGKLLIFQKIGLDRKLAEITIGAAKNNYQVIVKNNDHVVLSSDIFIMGVYGDSTIILSPKKNDQEIKFNGAFAPQYKGELKGEVLVADMNGGMGIFPKKSNPYVKAGRITFLKADAITLGDSYWRVNYGLISGQQLMITTFPPKEFDYQKACELRLIHTGGCTDNIRDESIGTLPSDEVVKKWSKYVNIIAIQGSGMYPGHSRFKNSHYRYPERNPGTWTFGGPYNPAMPSELKRVIETAHKLSMKVLCYTSPFYHYLTPDKEAYLNDVKTLLQSYNLDGIYVDTLYIDKVYPGGKIVCDKIDNWELMRRLRKMLGPNKLIYYHGSSDKSPVAAVPNIDALCDIVLYGEDVPFSSFQDDYILYQVRKFNISNVVGLIKAEGRASTISIDEVVRQMLSMNNRMRWVAYPVFLNGKCSWPLTPPGYMLEYFNLLQNDCKN